MNTATNYLPHAIFATEGDTVPRAMVAPQRYIQGEGVLNHTGKYLSLINASRAGILVSQRGQQADGARVIDSLKQAGIESVVSTFNGECSLEEIERMWRK